MKKYLKNKNFIPNDFIDKVNVDENKKNNKLISILIILNIIIIPNSLDKVFYSKDKIKESNDQIENNLYIEKGIKKENIEYWINNIYPGIVNMNIQNNNGIIQVKSKESVFKIEERDEIKINSINKTDKNYFILEVSL